MLNISGLNCNTVSIINKTQSQSELIKANNPEKTLKSKDILNYMHFTGKYINCNGDERFFKKYKKKDNEFPLLHLVATKSHKAAKARLKDNKPKDYQELVNNIFDSKDPVSFIHRMINSRKSLNPEFFDDSYVKDIQARAFLLVSPNQRLALLCKYNEHEKKNLIHSLLTKSKTINLNEFKGFIYDTGDDFKKLMKNNIMCTDDKIGILGKDSMLDGYKALLNNASSKLTSSIIGDIGLLDSQNLELFNLLEPISLKGETVQSELGQRLVYSPEFEGKSDAIKSFAENASLDVVNDIFDADSLELLSDKDSKEVRKILSERNINEVVNIKSIYSPESFLVID